MTISANYPNPIMVNGFLCKNCTDLDYAKKHIDPQHPRSGPYGIDAKDDPTVNQKTPSGAVTFAGNLSGLNANQASVTSRTISGPAGTSAGTASYATIGQQLNISA
jgi:hypothetical protein